MKKYAVELDAYLWAENDEQAKEIANKMAELLQSLDDNSARPTKLVEAKGLQTRNVKL